MLTVARSPLRVSLFGGGSDFPEYYCRKPAAVLGMGIDAYVWVSGLRLRGLQPYNVRVAYSRVESVQSYAELQHPLLRVILADYEALGPIDLSITSDLPGNSGLGSSSACAVATILMLELLSNRHPSKMEIAERANYYERVVLNEAGGRQDPLHCAFGGLNKFAFSADNVSVFPITSSAENIEELIRGLWLVPAGGTRSSAVVQVAQQEAVDSQLLDLKLGSIVSLVEIAERTLRTSSVDSIREEIGYLLNESWMIKKKLTDSVSNDLIEQIYARGISAGASGGKLCGAGGGGYILFCVPKASEQSFLCAFSNSKILKVSIDNQGLFHTRF
jgi:D-glycero-alpha-D-manno-heptose-7-phosphate kinase